MTTGRTSHIPPAPREVAHTNDIWVSLCVAVALGLAAVTIALWPSPQRAEAATQTPSETPGLATKVPLSSSASQAGLHEDLPTRFTNPFDASETFEFPAGTTEDDARQSVAEILVERARERGAETKSVKRVHNRPIRIPRLVSKSIFENAS